MGKGGLAGIVDSLLWSRKQRTPSVRAAVRQKSEDGGRRDQKKRQGGEREATGSNPSFNKFWTNLCLKLPLPEIEVWFDSSKVSYL